MIDSKCSVPQCWTKYVFPTCRAPRKTKGFLPRRTRHSDNYICASLFNRVGFHHTLQQKTIVFRYNGVELQPVRSV